MDINKDLNDKDGQTTSAAVGHCSCYKSPNVRVFLDQLLMHLPIEHPVGFFSFELAMPIFSLFLDVNFKP
jgi:hypothetical protein